MRPLAVLGCILTILCIAGGAAADDMSAPPPTLVPPAAETAAPIPVPDAKRALQAGDSGEDVYRLKVRMQQLGYFNPDTALSDTVSDVTLERVNLLLSDIGMAQVTVITREIQNIVFSRDDLAVGFEPTPTPQPLIRPQGMPQLPALTAGGFLQEAGGEYVYADAQDGLWYYISDALYINIRRYNDAEAKNIWLEAEVKTGGDEQLLNFFVKKGQSYQTPVEIARERSIVLAFTDDFYSMRKYGTVIRDGKIYRDYVRVSSTSYPPGDVLAVFADGSMLACEFDACTAQQLQAIGAVHVLSFGPWLLSNGAMNPRLVPGDYMHYREPRIALGMITPGHYVILAADGRYDGARGVYIEWMAKRMQEIGVREAINLDGGGTTALVFMGKQLSRVAYATEDGGYTRKVTSLLGFGISEDVPN